MPSTPCNVLGFFGGLASTEHNTRVCIKSLLVYIFVLLRPALSKFVTFLQQIKTFFYGQNTDRYTARKIQRNKVVWLWVNPVVQRRWYRIEEVQLHATLNWTVNHPKQGKPAQKSQRLYYTENLGPKSKTFFFFYYLHVCVCVWMCFVGRCKSGMCCVRVHVVVSWWAYVWIDLLLQIKEQDKEIEIQR